MRSARMLGPECPQRVLCLIADEGLKLGYFLRRPLLTVRSTLVLRGCRVPGRLLCAITWPFLTLALKACLILPAAHLRALRAAFAFATVFPFTFGTTQRTTAGGRTAGGGGAGGGDGGGGDAGG
jgi:uncharacterized membrane protein YgcG